LTVSIEEPYDSAHISYEATARFIKEARAGLITTKRGVSLLTIVTRM
jgi:hypothetical protein